VSGRITDHSGCGLDAAPYVLGALEPEEAGAFARHMERCAVCRDEVAALAPVLDVLPAAAPARPASRALRRRVLRAVRAEPKDSGHASRIAPGRPVRAGWLALAAAAAAALAIAFAAQPPPPRVISASVGRAELRVDDGHGELIVEYLAPLGSDRVYEMWLQTGRGTPAPSTLFAVSRGGSADVGVPGDLHGITRVLVTVEPRGGSLVPTTRAVIQVPLANVQRS
jgi:anti-sigma-K factor RskA